MEFSSILIGFFSDFYWTTFIVSLLSMDLNNVQHQAEQDLMLFYFCCWISCVCVCVCVFNFMAEPLFLLMVLLLAHYLSHGFRECLLFRVIGGAGAYPSCPWVTGQHGDRRGKKYARLQSHLLSIQKVHSVTNRNFQLEAEKKSKLE